MGQVAYLGGDHCKSAPLFSRARRLHRRVEGQDIRLEGDPFDDADNVDDFSSTNC